MYRWSLCTGGFCVKMVPMYRWSLCTGDASVQVVPMYVQVASVYRWSLCTGSPYVQVFSSTYFSMIVHQVSTETAHMDHHGPIPSTIASSVSLQPVQIEKGLDSNTHTHTHTHTFVHLQFICIYINLGIPELLLYKPDQESNVIRILI